MCRSVAIFCFLTFFTQVISENGNNLNLKLFHDAVEACAKTEDPPLEIDTLTQALKQKNLNSIYGSGILCIYKSIGVFDHKWNIKAEVVQDFLKNLSDDADLNEEIAGICSKKKSTPEESSIELFNCIAKRIKYDNNN